MKYCLLCENQCHPFDSIIELLKPPSRIREYLCKACEQKMEGLQCVSRCPACLGELVDNSICIQCLHWEDELQVKLKHSAIYAYNGFAKDIIWRIKHNRDIKLAKVLILLLEQHIVETYDLSKTIFIPYPSSTESIKTRRFSLTHYLLEHCRYRVETCDVFLTIAHKTENQHKKKKEERLAYAHEILQYDQNLVEQVMASGKMLVLVDDVFTTGASMVAAYKQLMRLGCNQLASISIFR